MKTDEIPIHNFGVLPDSVTIWNGGPTRAAIETRVRFSLELWRRDGNFELRHNRQTLELSASNAARLKLIGMRPAKGAGYSELRLGAEAVSFPPLLLSGRYDDLGWLRAVARKLGALIGNSVVEEDLGSDC